MYLFLVVYLFLDYVTLLFSYKGFIACSETDMTTNDEWVKIWKTIKFLCLPTDAQ